MSYAGITYRGAEIFFPIDAAASLSFSQFENHLLSCRDERIVDFINDLEFRIGELVNDGEASHRHLAVLALYQEYQQQGIRILNISEGEKIIGSNLRDEDYGMLHIGKLFFRDHHEMANRIAEDYLDR